MPTSSKYDDVGRMYRIHSYEGHQATRSTVPPLKSTSEVSSNLSERKDILSLCVVCTIAPRCCVNTEIRLSVCALAESTDRIRSLAEKT
jgi:hypothetical protein